VSIVGTAVLVEALKRVVVKGMLEGYLVPRITSF